MRRRMLAAALGLWCTVRPATGLAPGLAAQQPLASRADHAGLRHDALRYEIALVLPDTGSRFSAEVATRWIGGGAGPVALDLDSSLTVTAAAVNGRAVRWRRAGNRVELPVSAVRGAELTTRIAYEGVPADGLIIRGSGASLTIFADNWPDRARRWLASQDHPADKAEVSWTIDAPAGFRVVATGRLTAADTSGPSRWRWQFANAEPVPTYTMVVGMARFAVTALPPAGCPARCVPVSVFTYAEDSAFAVGGPFRRAGEILDFFASRFGPFPYAELRHVESATRFGGMENATAIFYDENSYRRRRTSESTVAHETAHQWFGDAVTEADWHHVWLSEGFATYGAALWAEHVGGDSALRAAMQGARAAVLRSPVLNRPILDTTITDRMALLNANSYQKGAWVLHSLRGLIGDSAFFRGLARYYREFRNGTALSSDFARVMGEESGQDLGWYFLQALTRPGYPELEAKTELEGGHLVLTIRQVQRPGWGVFRMPNLAVRLDDRVVTADVSGPVTRLVTHWEGERPPARVELDPDGWWLFTARTP